MRYECSDPQFAGVFVEFSEAWSRGEMRRFFDPKLPRDEWLALVASKIVALYLPRLYGEPLTNPADISQATTDDVDVRLWHWLNTAMTRAVGDVGTLGEALGRTLWPSAESNGTALPKP